MTHEAKSALQQALAILEQIPDQSVAANKVRAAIHHMDRKEQANGGQEEAEGQTEGEGQGKGGEEPVLADDTVERAKAESFPKWPGTASVEAADRPDGT